MASRRYPESIPVPQKILDRISFLHIGQGLSFRKMGELDEFSGIPWSILGLIWRRDVIAINSPYLEKLGIPRQELAPVCKKCGQVHTTKRCTANQAQKSRPAQHEHFDQVAIIAGLRFYHEQYPVLQKVFAVPNGGKRSIATAKKLKAEGVLKGIPDLMLCAGRRGFIGMAVELKHGDNPASEDQRSMITWLRTEGWWADVLNDVQETIDAFVWYASGEFKTIATRVEAIRPGVIREYRFADLTLPPPTRTLPNLPLPNLTLPSPQEERVNQEES